MNLKLLDKYIPKRKRFRVLSGYFLILFSLLILSYIYFPLALVYFFPPKIVSAFNDNKYYLTIPKINAQAPIIEGVDPFNEQGYRKALGGGIAHAKNTSLPNEPGRIYLFAHSSDSPFRITRYNTIFLRLNELKNGDIIKINKNDKEYKYEVVDKKELWPNDIQYLQKSESNQLILQTCTPIGTSFKRLLVFAQPIN